MDVNLGALSMGQKESVYEFLLWLPITCLLLMEEPTNGLDIQEESQFRKFMASGMTERIKLL